MKARKYYTVLDEETDSEIDLELRKNLRKEAQCSELLDRLQRTMAEFDNYRKRTQKKRLSF